jgi:uncharacterized protein YuzE
MKIRHDREADALKITFNDGKQHTSQIINEDFIVKLDEGGRVVAIEILAVSENVTEPNKFEYVDHTHPRYDQTIKEAS